MYIISTPQNSSPNILKSSDYLNTAHFKMIYTFESLKGYYSDIYVNIIISWETLNRTNISTSIKIFARKQAENMLTAISVYFILVSITNLSIDRWHNMKKWCRGIPMNEHYPINQYEE